MTFENANSTYWEGKSDFEIVVKSGAVHKCRDCSHFKTCIPGSMSNPVKECNHFEQSKDPRFVCEDVKDALRDLKQKMEKIDHNLPGFKECMKALEETEDNWKSEDWMGDL